MKKQTGNESPEPPRSQVNEKKAKKTKVERFAEVEKTLEEEDVFFKSFRNPNQRPLKTLAMIYKGNYTRILIALVFHLIQYTPVLVQPLVLAYVVNAAAYHEGMYKIYLGIGLMVALTAQNILSNYLYTLNYSKANRSVEAGLRSSMVRKLQQLSITYHKEIQSGRIQSKIMRDVEAVEDLSNQLINSVFMILVNILFSVCVVVSKSIVVFLFFLAAVPVAIALSQIFFGKMRSCNREFRSEMEQTSASVMEMVQMIPVTKAHALEKVEIKKANKQLLKVATRGYQLDVIQSFFGSISWASFMLFQVGCLFFTATLAYRGTIRIGDITLYQSYFSSIIGQITGIMNLLPILSKGLESVRSIGDIMAAHDIEENHGKPKLAQVQGEFDFQDVSFQYSDGNKDVLDHLDLHVKQGETIALVGESGCGKTTLLNLVIGFYRPTEGKVLLDGHDLFAFDLRSYRKHLAVVPQNSILFSGTIRDNITYGMPDVSDKTVWEAITAANLEEFVREKPEGLDATVGIQGDRLSGGQRQRMSIARALIRNPKVIVLDEATSALDSVSERQIQEALDRLCANRTTFIVAHRLSTIRNADHIAFIQNGKCIEYGTFEELMAKKGAFYQLKMLQS